MAVSVVQVATSQNNSATFASNVTAGNTIIVAAYAQLAQGIVISTSGLQLGGLAVPGSVALQGFQSDNQSGPCAGHAVWMMPNCAGGSQVVSWQFTPTGTGMTAVGTIAYEVAGLGSNPLPTMGNVASSIGSTAIDTGSTGTLQFADELVVAASMTNAGAAAAPGGWTATNNSTNNCWAGYQTTNAPGSSFDWAQTGASSDYWSAGVVSVKSNSAIGGPYRLFNGVNGPASPISYSGNFLAGVVFKAMAGDCWFEGFWWWVCGSGQATGPTKCALWQQTGQGSATNTLVPGSVVTSATLTAGQWNYIPLPLPVQLSIGTSYIAAVAVNGNFPDTNNTWGFGQIYPAGICLGPLNAYGKVGTNQSPYGAAQGVFTTAGNDPEFTCPTGGSNTDNFWVDVQISTQAPAAYAGTYRLWPGSGGSQELTSGDSTVNYVVGTQIDLSRPCKLANIWYYSPSGTAQLATRADVWDIATQQSVAGISSPAWSGAAGSGWVSAPFSLPVTLPPGRYRVTVYNGAASPDSWNAKSLYYFLSGWSLRGDYAVCDGSGGITSGPLYAPDTANAQPTSYYQQAGSGPGQAVFAVGPPNAYPDTYVDDLFQNYWIDLEVTPIPNSGAFLDFFS
jgi:hypothetical protein